MVQRVHTQSVAHLVDEFNFSGDSNNCDGGITNTIGDVTAYADTDMTYVEGKPGFAFNVGGFFNTGATGVNTAAYDPEMFIDLTAAGRRVGVYPPGIGSASVALTIGNFGYEGATNILSQERTSPIGGAILLNVGWQGTDPLIRSVILDVDTAVAATAQGTAIQRGAAAATDTVVGILRLMANPGGAGNNTLDVTIDSDSAEAFDQSAETQLTFTQLDQTSVASFEVVEAAGAVTDTWWRVDYTYAGAGSRTFNLIITFGIRPT